MKKMEFFDKSDLKFIGWNIVIAIVVGIGILVALIAYLRRYTEHGVEVDVIDVRGLVVAEANPLLADQGLHLVVVDSTYSDKVPFGTIVEQDPKPMSHAKHGRAVYVTINATTKRQVTMPNLQDMSYRQAETTLRGMGLEVDSIYEYEPSEFRDLVLDVQCNGVSVQPGEKLAVGTKVRLVVGFGRHEGASGGRFRTGYRRSGSAFRHRSDPSGRAQSAAEPAVNDRCGTLRRAERRGRDAIRLSADAERRRASD